MKHPQIVSANDLRQGHVVYLTEAATWTRDLAQAAVATDPGQAQALLAAGLAQPQIATGAYLADVALGAAAPRPLHYREQFRARGAAVLADLGHPAAEAL